MSTPRERPILFSGEMVRKLLDGTKTQTRRVIKPQPMHVNSTIDGTLIGWYDPIGHEGRPLVNRYGQAGDKLWCRETFVIESNANIESADVYPPPFADGRPTRWHDDPENGRVWQQCHYRATDPTPELAYDDTDEPTCRWKPSIFMPRWASRITLEVTDVRVERLDAITEEDARAEGVSTALRAQLFGVDDDHAVPLVTPPDWKLVPSYRNKYASLWDSINGKTWPWSSNPFVWVLSFRVLP